MAALTDIALTNTPYNPHYTTRQNLIKYAESVKLCGADYIEIDREAANFLEDGDVSNSFILRVESEKDIKLCKDRKYAFVSVPFSLCGMFRKLAKNQNIIAEIYADEYNVHSQLLALKASPYLKYISVIRITGCFSFALNRIEELISWFKGEFIQSVELCPLNDMMNACAVAVAAGESGADSVCAVFGSEKKFSSLENYIVNCELMTRTFKPAEIIRSICETSAEYINIFGIMPCGLDMLAELPEKLCAAVCNPETGVIYRSLKKQKSRKNEKEYKKNAVLDKIYSLELDGELEKTVIDAVRKAMLIMKND